MRPNALVPPRRKRQRFRDRREAGRALGDALAGLDLASPIVAALPRGGVPVGFEVAGALAAPLDIVLVRKLGAPGQPELAIGAIGEDEQPLFDQRLLELLGVQPDDLERIVARERTELRRRGELYRERLPAIEVAGRTVVVVDDGLATGATAIAAARVLRSRGAREVILATPVCPAGSRARIGPHFDRFVCLSSPEPFIGVGGAYEDFGQTDDDEVVRLLQASRESTPSPHPVSADADVEIDVGAGNTLRGILRVPADPVGLVVFVHGSGSSRLSPRNQHVAARLGDARLATLLFDLLTEAEADERTNVFDVGLLTERLIATLRWTARQRDLESLPVGLFGASTGAAAALDAACLAPERVGAVVSRGGRPDLAGHGLADVRAPTLFIVGALDPQVLALNREAASMLTAPHRVAVVPGGDHLFTQPEALAEVAELATEWFEQYLSKVPRE